MAASLVAGMASMAICAGPAASSGLTLRQDRAAASLIVNIGQLSRSEFIGSSKALCSSVGCKSNMKQRQGLSHVSPIAMALATGEEAVETEKSARAFLKGLRMSPMKLRRVVNQVRGRTYEDILMILQFMPYRACLPVYDLVLSCAANAENNLGLKKSDLYVSEALVDAGPTLKRFQPRAQGRGFPIRKRTCRVTIIMKQVAK